MKTYIYIFLSFTIFLFPLNSETADIPSSARSREAVSRVKPSLKKELADADLTYGSPVFIRIFKDSKELEVWIQKKDHFHLFKTYDICTYGWRGLGPKIKLGDGKAPEGFYYVTPAQINPLSEFHLSFNLGYPNNYDRAHGRTGSALMVHGSCVSIGCYAMTDKNIEEIFALAVASLKNGQKYFRVHIFPFRMTNENMNFHRLSKWFGFWQNLKQGYDFFEHNGHNPPDVTVQNKQYIFKDPKNP